MTASYKILMPVYFSIIQTGHRHHATTETDERILFLSETQPNT